MPPGKNLALKLRMSPTRWGPNGRCVAWARSLRSLLRFTARRSRTAIREPTPTGWANREFQRALISKLNEVFEYPLGCSSPRGFAIAYLGVPWVPWESPGVFVPQGFCYIIPWGPVGSLRIPWGVRPLGPLVSPGCRDGMEPRATLGDPMGDNSHEIRHH